MLPHQFIKSAQIAFCLLILITAPLTHSASDNVFEQQIQAQQQEQNRLQGELSYTREKRREAEEALAQMEAELKEKEQQLAEMKARFDEPRSKSQQDLLANEQQRLALTELAIRSRIATVVRWERKEQELQDELHSAAEKIAGIQDRQQAEARRARREAEAKSQALAAQLEALRRENEALRVAMEEKARSAQSAQEEAARLAALARAEEEAELAAEAEAAALAAEAELEALSATAPVAGTGQLGLPSLIPMASSQYTPPPQVWMFEEVPNADAQEPDADEQAFDEVTQEEVRRDDAIILRSRSLPRPVTLESSGEQVYRAEVKVQPGRAYFNINNRRYRGQFPDDGISTYVFTYDMTDEEQPRLNIQRSQENTAIAGDSADAY